MLPILDGWHLWQQDYSGEINSVTSSMIIDIEKNLRYDNKRGNVFYAAVEQPLPVISASLLNYRVPATTAVISSMRSCRLPTNRYLASARYWVGAASSWTRKILTMSMPILASPAVILV